MAFEHRALGYKLIRGEGLEIGALHMPAVLSEYCTVKFCDVMTREEAIELFPEVNKQLFVTPDYIANLDKEALSLFEDNQFDFVILNHVIEHLANPIRTISELFRVVKVGGKVVISCPDKDYTFDRKRKLTEFDHLLTEYKNNETEVTDEHYIDFLYGVHPEVFSENHHYVEALESVRKRREHVHVWNSQTFQIFLEKSFKLLKIEARLNYVNIGAQNQFEHFSIWEKKTTPQPLWNKIKSFFFQLEWGKK